MTDEWNLNWSHGSVTVNAQGGMVGPLEFLLPDQRRVQPFSLFPWHLERLAPGEPQRSPLLARGRGDWFCAPFGIARPDPSSLTSDWQAVFREEARGPAHGAAAHGLWRLVDRASNFIEIAYDDFSDGPLKAVRRRVTVADGSPSISCEITVEVNKSCRMPMGIHPTFRLPMNPQALELKPGRFQFGCTFPGTFEEASSLFAPGRRFSSISTIPARDGGTVNASRLPMSRPVDDIVQLCGIDGHFAIHNHEENYATSLEWEAEKLPSCILWICSGGRVRLPWSGRYFAVGVDPICSAFDLGQGISAGENPLTRAGIRTAVQLEPGRPWSIQYQIGAKPLGSENVSRPAIKDSLPA